LYNARDGSSIITESPLLAGSTSLALALTACTGETATDDCASHDRTAATADNFPGLEAKVDALNPKTDYVRVTKDDGHTYINAFGPIGKDKLIGHYTIKHPDYRWIATIHEQCID
jgi:hypothetical protein